MKSWLGFVDDTGKFALDKRLEFVQYLADKFRGHEVVLTVKKKQNQRSLSQNAYWWAVPVKILAAECGYTPSQMHYALLGEKFGYMEGPTGKVVPVKPSSSDLTVGEFSALIEWVLDWAPAELNCIIPSPTDPRAHELMEADDAD